MTDRLLIPATVPDDRMRLLDGWTGSVWLPDATWGQRCTFWWFGRYEPRIVRHTFDREHVVEPAPMERLHLEARCPEIRAHVVDALAAGVKCVDLCGHGGPGSAPVSEGCVGCTGRFGKAWITPPYDCRWMLHYPNLTPNTSADDSASLCACSVARVRAGLEPVCGVFTRWVDDDEANDDAATLGYALRNPDGTLTLPWPDEVFRD